MIDGGISPTYFIPLNASFADSASVVDTLVLGCGNLLLLLPYLVPAFRSLLSPQMMSTTLYTLSFVHSIHLLVWTEARGWICEGRLECGGRAGCQVWSDNLQYDKRGIILYVPSFSWEILRSIATRISDKEL